MEASGEWSRSGWWTRNSWEASGKWSGSGWWARSSWDSAQKGGATEHDDSWSGSSGHLCGWSDSAAGATEHSRGETQEIPVGAAIVHGRANPCVAMALARRTATRSRSPASARAAEQRSGSRSGASPRVPRRHNRHISERTQATSEASEHEMPSLWPKSTAARNRSAASARAAEQRYESPWVFFRFARCGRLIELLHTRSQRPVTELEFRHALSGGASEHVSGIAHLEARAIISARWRALSRR